MKKAIPRSTKKATHQGITMDPLGMVRTWVEEAGEGGVNDSERVRVESEAVVATTASSK